MNLQITMEFSSNCYGRILPQHTIGPGRPKFNLVEHIINLYINRRISRDEFILFLNEVEKLDMDVFGSKIYTMDLLRLVITLRFEIEKEIEKEKEQDRCKHEYECFKYEKEYEEKKLHKFEEKKEQYEQYERDHPDDPAVIENKKRRKYYMDVQTNMEMYNIVFFTEEDKEYLRKIKEFYEKQNE